LAQVAQGDVPQNTLVPDDDGDSVRRWFFRRRSSLGRENACGGARQCSEARHRARKTPTGPRRTQARSHSAGSARRRCRRSDSGPWSSAAATPPGRGCSIFGARAPPRRTSRPGVRLDDALGGLERQMIVKALEETKQVKARAARLLGVSERSLWYKLRKHQLS